MNNKEWKEKMKLDRATRVSITYYIVMIILDIAVGIIEKNPIWIMCSLVWFCLVITEYFNKKMLKSKEIIIETQQELIEQLYKTLSKCRIEIRKIKDIKVPRHWKQPKESKMKERWMYLKENKNLKAPIVIDNNNNLKDGYTSYLIVKELGVKEFVVKVVNNNEII